MINYQTKCPHCEGIFEVTADQLAARNGFVRCGKCFEIFKADDHLTFNKTQTQTSLQQLSDTLTLEALQEPKTITLTDSLVSAPVAEATLEAFNFTPSTQHTTVSDIHFELTPARQNENDALDLSKTEVELDALAYESFMQQLPNIEIKKPSAALSMAIEPITQDATPLTLIDTDTNPSITSEVVPSTIPTPPVFDISHLSLLDEDKKAASSDQLETSSSAESKPEEIELGTNVNIPNEVRPPKAKISINSVYGKPNTTAVELYAINPTAETLQVHTNQTTALNVLDVKDSKTPTSEYAELTAQQPAKTMSADFDALFTNDNTKPQQTISKSNDSTATALDIATSIYAAPTTDTSLKKAMVLPLSDMTEVFKQREASRVLTAFNEFHVHQDTEDTTKANDDWLKELLETPQQKDVQTNTPASNISKPYQTTTPISSTVASSDKIDAVLEKIKLPASTPRKQDDNLFSYLRSTVATETIPVVKPSDEARASIIQEGQLSARAQAMLAKHERYTKRNPVVKVASSGAFGLLLWGAVCLFLLLTLAIQYIYFNKSTIKTNTFTAKASALICHIGICNKNNIPQDLDQIALSKILASKSNVNPAYTHVTAVIHNKSDTTVMLPKLTFRVINGGKIESGRTVIPAEYLPTELSGIRLLLPQSTMNVDFSLNIAREKIDKYGLDTTY